MKKRKCVRRDVQSFVSIKSWPVCDDLGPCFGSYDDKDYSTVVLFQGDDFHVPVGKLSRTWNFLREVSRFGGS